jgi:hypothetical protein
MLGGGGKEFRKGNAREKGKKLIDGRGNIR